MSVTAVHDSPVVSPRWRPWVRVVWIGLALIALVNLAADAPRMLDPQSTLCAPPATPCFRALVTIEEAALLPQIGLTLNSYNLLSVVSQYWLVAALWLSLSALVFWRKQDDWMGVLTSWFMIGFPLAILTGYVGESNPILIMFGSILRWFNGILPVLFFFFPNGRFVPRWTRWLMLLIWLPLSFLAVFFPNTWLSYWGWPAPWPQLISLGFLAIALLSVFYRYRRVADAIQRQQIKWFLLGVALIFVNYLIDFFVWQVSPFLLGHDLITYGLPAVLWELIQGTLWAVSEFLLAMCIAFSIFRYRLWDIDLIIRRTVLWALISGLGLALYLLAVGATSFFLGSQTDYVIPLVALVLVALIARPLYQRLDQGLSRVWPLESPNPSNDSL
jgi:hypothetical protein